MDAFYMTGYILFNYLVTQSSVKITTFLMVPLRSPSLSELIELYFTFCIKAGKQTNSVEKTSTLKAFHANAIQKNKVGCY